MDQNRPVKQNTFVLVAVVLFNLIWLTLLFLSCQADNEPNLKPTPEARMRDHLTWKIADSHLDAAIEMETRNSGRGVPKRKDYPLPFRKTTDLSDYSVPLYNPPSTGSITPFM